MALKSAENDTTITTNTTAFCTPHEVVNGIKSYISAHRPRELKIGERCHSTTLQLHPKAYVPSPSRPQPKHNQSSPRPMDVKGSTRRYHVRCLFGPSLAADSLACVPCDANPQSASGVPVLRGGTTQHGAGSQLRHNAFFSPNGQSSMYKCGLRISDGRGCLAS